MTAFILAALLGGPIIRISAETGQPISVSHETKGWRQFKWGMTPEQVRQLGAETFRDSQGTKRFGLPEVDFLPGKHFWVDLGFYSHIQLAFIMISMESLVCAENEYVALLNDLREKHGKEREAKNLD
ncbi:MAG: hypothetical protein VYC17_02155 [Nitrospinota bacterium]|nr:hypothetical protein [Nitrospinota bacterium]